MQHFQLLKSFLRVKWLFLVVAGLEIVAVVVVARPRFVFGSTVEIVSYVFQI